MQPIAFQRSDPWRDYAKPALGIVGFASMVICALSFVPSISLLNRNIGWISFGIECAAGLGLMVTYAKQKPIRSLRFDDDNDAVIKKYQDVGFPPETLIQSILDRNLGVKKIFVIDETEHLSGSIFVENLASIPHLTLQEAIDCDKNLLKEDEFDLMLYASCIALRDVKKEQKEAQGSLKVSEYSVKFLGMLSSCAMIFMTFAPFFLKFPSHAIWIAMGGSIVLSVILAKVEFNRMSKEESFRSRISWLTSLKVGLSKPFASLHQVTQGDLPIRPNQLYSDQRLKQQRSTKELQRVVHKYDLAILAGTIKNAALCANNIHDEEVDFEREKERIRGNKEALLTGEFYLYEPQTLMRSNESISLDQIEREKDSIQKLYQECEELHHNGKIYKSLGFSTENQPVGPGIALNIDFTQFSLEKLLYLASAGDLQFLKFQVLIKQQMSDLKKMSRVGQIKTLEYLRLYGLVLKQQLEIWINYVPNELAGIKDLLEKIRLRDEDCDDLDGQLAQLNSDFQSIPSMQFPAAAYVELINRLTKLKAIIIKLYIKVERANDKKLTTKIDLQPRLGSPYEIELQRKMQALDEKQRNYHKAITLSYLIVTIATLCIFIWMNENPWFICATFAGNLIFAQIENQVTKRRMAMQKEILQLKYEEEYIVNPPSINNLPRNPMMQRMKQLSDRLSLDIPRRTIASSLLS